MGLFTRKGKIGGRVAQEPPEAVKLAQAYRWIHFGMDSKAIAREAARDPQMRPFIFGNEISGYDTTFAGKPFTIGFRYHQDRLYAITFGYYDREMLEAKEQLVAMMTELYGQPFAVTGDVIAWQTDDRLAKVMTWRKGGFITNLELYIEYTPMTDIMEQERVGKAERAAKAEVENFC